MQFLLRVIQHVSTLSNLNVIVYREKSYDDVTLLRSVHGWCTAAIIVETIFLTCFILGFGGLSAQESVIMIRNGIEMYQETKPKHLKTIKVMIFDSLLLPSFQQLNSVTIQPQTSTKSIAFSQPPSTQPSTSSSSVDPPSKPSPGKQKQTTLVLTLCSTDEKKIDDVS